MECELPYVFRNSVDLMVDETKDDPERNKFYDDLYDELDRKYEEV